MREVRRTIAFMLRVAWREKPALFASYLILFVGNAATTMKNVLIPKLLLDELLLVTKGRRCRNICSCSSCTLRWTSGWARWCG